MNLTCRQQFVENKYFNYENNPPATMSQSYIFLQPLLVGWPGLLMLVQLALEAVENKYLNYEFNPLATMSQNI